jgi:hypothetical protein
MYAWGLDDINVPGMITLALAEGLRWDQCAERSTSFAPWL